jgi:ABC-type nitrate/sulfonate/bicarbonate transport system substrate-binding protein
MPKITIGMSGWTGFAPLTLAEQAGIFRANGIEVGTRFVPQRERSLALAGGALNCIVTTVDSMILWASAAPLQQVLVLTARAAATASRCARRSAPLPICAARPSRSMAPVPRPISCSPT